MAQLCVYMCKSVRYQHPDIWLSGHAFVMAVLVLNHLININVRRELPR